MIDPFWLTMIGLSAVLIWAAYARWDFGRDLSKTTQARVRLNAKLEEIQKIETKLNELVSEREKTRASEEPGVGGKFEFASPGQMVEISKRLRASSKEHRRILRSGDVKMWRARHVKKREFAGSGDDVFVVVEGNPDINIIEMGYEDPEIVRTFVDKPQTK